MKTNFALNTLNNMIVFFKSIIGPYTKKASMEAVGNKFRNEVPKNEVLPLFLKSPYLVKSGFFDQKSV